MCCFAIANEIILFSQASENDRLVSFVICVPKYPTIAFCIASWDASHSKYPHEWDMRWCLLEFLHAVISELFYT